jgi:hypothetical protein
MLESEYDEFSRLIKISHLAIKEATRTEYLTIVQEESSQHFHLWFFPWTQFIIERYGRPSLNKIREIMAAYQNKTIEESEWKELEGSIKRIKAVFSRIAPQHIG